MKLPKLYSKIINLWDVKVAIISQSHVLFLGKPPGYDRVRNAEIGNKDFELDVMEEAYTTEHWIVRIYKVKDMPNRGVRW